MLSEKWPSKPGRTIPTRKEQDAEGATAARLTLVALFDRHVIADQLPGSMQAGATVYSETSYPPLKSLLRYHHKKRTRVLKDTQ